MQRAGSFGQTSTQWSTTSTHTPHITSTSRRDLSPPRHIPVDYANQGTGSTSARTNRAASAIVLPARLSHVSSSSRGMSPTGRAMPVDYAHQGTPAATTLTVTTTAPHFVSSNGATRVTSFTCSITSLRPTRPSREMSPPRSSRQMPD